VTSNHHCHHNTISQQAQNRTHAEKTKFEQLGLLDKHIRFLLEIQTIFWQYHFTHLLVCLPILPKLHKKIIILTQSYLNAEQYIYMLNLYDQGISLDKCDPI